MTPLITETERAQLRANGIRADEDEEFDPWPVVKLFTPDGAGTWLLSSVDPDCEDIAFGLCDLGFGCPELGSVYLSEIAGVRGVLGLHVERDRQFIADKPISEYARAASRARTIVTD